MRPLFELVCLLCQVAGAGSSPSVLTFALPSLQAEMLAEHSAPPRPHAASSPLSTGARSRPVPAARARNRTARPSPPALAIGERWLFREGRELRLFLTPTPAQCAPLMELKF